IEAFRKSVTYLKTESPAKISSQALADTRIASVYFTLQNFDSAFYYCNKSYKNLLTANAGSRGENREMAGYYHFIHGNYDEALKSYSIAQSIYSGIQG